MNVEKIIQVPTGKIAIATGAKGRLLEFLCVADYGKAANIKADFLGLPEEVMEVPHQEMLPLTEKMVVTISSQYGCSMGCEFCDVPKVGPGVNVTYKDLMNQISSAMHMMDNHNGKRLNIHFARMGEPTFNKHVLAASVDLKQMYEHSFETVHPVVSTMMPRKNKELFNYLCEWMRIKNEVYGGEAGLQLSINSTNNEERETMFSGSSLDFDSVGALVKALVEEHKPVGRKITLNFALANYEIDPAKLLQYFDPEHFLCKITPMHITHAVHDNEVRFVQDYRPVEAELKAAGYDVIVFVPSHEEDMGRITCGNAILSGSMPEVEHKVVMDNLIPVTTVAE